MSTKSRQNVQNKTFSRLYVKINKSEVTLTIIAEGSIKYISHNYDNNFLQAKYDSLSYFYRHILIWAI